jgi:hypothetical protein
MLILAAVANLLPSVHKDLTLITIRWWLIVESASNMENPPSTFLV